MAYSKIKRILLILLCVIVLFFPFWCVAGLCAEPVELSQVNGITITSNSNAFTENSVGNVKYFLAEKGYIYYISLGDGQANARLVSSSGNIPALNVPYSIVGSVTPGGSYTYVSNEDSYIGLATSVYWSVTREQVPGMNSAVGGLVDNVGINSIWDIFDISINYIVIAVCVAFGIFIVTLVIRKITKGKEGF